MIARSIIGATMALALAACQTTTNSVPESLPLGPGPKSLNINTSASLFQDVCVKTYPNFQKARTVLASKAFAAHPSTGTFYDGRQDVSFKLISDGGKKICSMVFTSPDNPIELGTAFGLASTVSKDGDLELDLGADNKAVVRASSTGRSTMTFTPARRANGKNWYRATLSPRN